MRVGGVCEKQGRTEHVETNRSGKISYYQKQLLTKA